MFKIKFELSFQSEKSQEQFDAANPEIVYCFRDKAIKQAKILAEASKYGNGVLSVINGNNVLEQICF